MDGRAGSMPLSSLRVVQTKTAVPIWKMKNFMLMVCDD